MRPFSQHFFFKVSFSGYWLTHFPHFDIHDQVRGKVIRGGRQEAAIRKEHRGTTWSARPPWPYERSPKPTAFNEFDLTATASTHKIKDSVCLLEHAAC